MNSPHPTSNDNNNYFPNQFSLLEENVDLIKNTNPHPTTSTPYVYTPVTQRNKNNSKKKKNSKKSSSPNDASRKIFMDENHETPRACSTPKSKGSVRDKIKMFNEIGQSSSLSKQLLPLINTEFATIDSIDISKISSIHPNFTDEENYSRDTDSTTNSNTNTCSCSNNSSSTISFTDVNTNSSWYRQTNLLDQKFSHIDSQDPNLLTDPELDDIFDKSEANIKILTPLLLKKLSKETSEYRTKLMELRKNDEKEAENKNLMVDVTPSMTKNIRKRPMKIQKPDDHMVTPEITPKRYKTRSFEVDNGSRRISLDDHKQNNKKKSSLGPNGEII